jgi:hypothetical protein
VTCPPTRISLGDVALGGAVEVRADLPPEKVRETAELLHSTAGDVTAGQTSRTVRRATSC